jgi:hypothetical protein
MAPLCARAAAYPPQPRSPAATPPPPPPPAHNHHLNHHHHPTTTTTPAGEHKGVKSFWVDSAARIDVASNTILHKLAHGELVETKDWLPAGPITIGAPARLPAFAALLCAWLWAGCEGCAVARGPGCGR